MKKTIERWSDWIVTCPFCNHKQYVSETKLVFKRWLDTKNDFVNMVEGVKCEKCGREFETIDLKKKPY